MTCDELAAQLTDFIDGRLAADVEAAALDHLATCSACETVLAGTRAVISEGRAYGRTPLERDERDGLLGRILRDVSDPER